ncbi:hypothetical protein ACLOJK_029254 [Asimina triloba]
MTNPNRADPGTNSSSDNPNVFLVGDHLTVDLDPGHLDDVCPIIRASIQRPATPHLKQHPTGVRSWDGPPNSRRSGSMPQPTLLVIETHHHSQQHHCRSLGQQQTARAHLKLHHVVGQIFHLPQLVRTHAPLKSAAMAHTHAPLKSAAMEEPWQHSLPQARSIGHHSTQADHVIVINASRRMIRGTPIKRVSIADHRHTGGGEDIENSREKISKVRRRKEFVGIQVAID